MSKPIAAAGIAAVAAMFAWTANAGSPPGPAQDRVYGGGFVPAGACTSGPDVFCTQGDREFSVLAVSSPGGGGAYGTVNFKTFTARVTCLAVNGNSAEIGGVVSDGPNAGDAYRLFVRDNGAPGSATPDEVSANFIDLPPVQATCNDLDSNALGSGYFTLAHGDLVVDDR